MPYGLRAEGHHQLVPSAISTTRRRRDHPPPRWPIRRPTTRKVARVGREGIDIVGTAIDGGADVSALVDHRLKRWPMMESRRAPWRPAGSSSRSTGSSMACSMASCFTTSIALDTAGCQTSSPSSPASGPAATAATVDRQGDAVIQAASSTKKGDGCGDVLGGSDIDQAGTSPAGAPVRPVAPQHPARPAARRRRPTPDDRAMAAAAARSRRQPEEAQLAAEYASLRADTKPLIDPTVTTLPVDGRPRRMEQERPAPMQRTTPRIIRSNIACQ